MNVNFGEYVPQPKGARRVRNRRLGLWLRALFSVGLVCSRQRLHKFLPRDAIACYYAPARRVGALSNDARLTSDVCRVHRA